MEETTYERPNVLDKLVGNAIHPRGGVSVGFANHIVKLVDGDLSIKFGCLMFIELWDIVVSRSEEVIDSELRVDVRWGA